MWIEVHHEDLTPAFAEGGGQVHGGRGFATAALLVRYGQSFHKPLWLCRRSSVVRMPLARCFSKARATRRDSSSGGASPERSVDPWRNFGGPVSIKTIHHCNKQHPLLQIWEHISFPDTLSLGPSAMETATVPATRSAGANRPALIRCAYYCNKCNCLWQYEHEPLRFTEALKRG